MLCLPLHPQFVCWSSNAQCDGISRRGFWEVTKFRWGHEGGALVMGLAPLQKKHQGVCSLSLPWDDTVRRWLQARGELSVGKCIGQNFDLRLQASRTVRYKSLFKPLSLRYFVMQPEQTKTVTVITTFYKWVNWGSERCSNPICLKPR